GRYREPDEGNREQHRQRSRRLAMRRVEVHVIRDLPDVVDDRCHHENPVRPGCPARSFHHFLLNHRNHRCGASSSPRTGSDRPPDTAAEVNRQSWGADFWRRDRRDAASEIAAAAIQTACTPDMTIAKISPGVPKMAATPARTKRPATTSAVRAKNEGSTSTPR